MQTIKPEIEMLLKSVEHTIKFYRDGHFTSQHLRGMLINLYSILEDEEQEGKLQEKSKTKCNYGKTITPR